MLSDLTKRSATTLYVVGGLAIAYGLLSAFWPGITTITFTIMWGIYALIDGIGALGAAFSSKEGKTWGILVGILGILAGLTAILRPGLSAAALAWVIGIWLMARGITEFIAAFGQADMKQKVLFALAGVFWFIAGCITVANPLEATITWTFWLGLLAIGWGIALVFAGATMSGQGGAADTASKA